MREKAFAVARVSKKSQAGDDHYSISAQLGAFGKYCDLEGMELIHAFTEPGTSGFVTDITKIPGLNEAVLRIEAGEATALIVHESSRLARTERLTGELADRLQAAGARFINLSMGGLDYSTPEGRMILANEAAMNSYWSRKTGQHSQKGKQQQFEQGLHIGQIPFGYTHALLTTDGLTATTRKFAMVTVPDAADAIRKAYEDYALGKNAHEITREWNAAGFKPHSTKGLDYFQPQSVRDILRNRTYTGQVQHLGEWREGVHAAIVTEEQFWAAQRQKPVTVRRAHPPLLLRGVATCLEGHRVYDLYARHSPKNPDKKHPYYREPSNDKQRTCSQSGRLWRADQPNEQVEAVLRTLAVDDLWLRYVEEHARTDGARNAAGERRRLESKLERVQEEYIEGRVSKERWNRILQDCQTQLAQLQGTEEPLAVTAGRLSSWWELWDGASPEARNRTCRLLFQSVVLDFDKREVSLVPHAEFATLLDARTVYVGQERRGQG